MVYCYKSAIRPIRVNMPRLIEIDDYTKKEIAKVIQYASENPYGEKYRLNLSEGKALPVGDNPDHVVHIHQGYRAVYSISTLKGERYHHLSVSYEENDKYPGVYEAEVILDLFGMGKSVHDLDSVWLEEKVQAVNFIKKVNDEQQG